jgi:hypothetical protein
MGLAQGCKYSDHVDLRLEETAIQWLLQASRIAVPIKLEGILEPSLGIARMILAIAAGDGPPSPAVDWLSGVS